MRAYPDKNIENKPIIQRIKPYGANVDRESINIDNTALPNADFTARPRLLNTAGSSALVNTFPEKITMSVLFITVCDSSIVLSSDGP